eukprot:COSAG01_NODE_36900_length_511_cov_0.910194_1_plen_26_part_01
MASLGHATAMQAGRRVTTTRGRGRRV